MISEFFNLLVRKLPTNIDELVTKNSVSVTFINPYSYFIANKQSVNVYKQFDYICFDGVSLVLIVKIMLGISTPRISFDMTSLAPKVFSFANEFQKSIYFIGSSQENIERFVQTFRLQYSNVDMLGFHNGFFAKGDKAKCFDNLKDLCPDIVIVGMGTPFQDILISDLKQILPESSFYSCGGFIHQYAERVAYYPKWIDGFNLRWLYRMYDEPKLIKRYLFFYPICIVNFIRQCYIFKKDAKKK